MASSEWRFFRSRRLQWPHGAIWMSFYVLLCIVGQNFCCEEESLAASLKQLCFCHNKHTLHCQGINDTHLFKTTPQSSFQGITHLKISESQLQCLHLDDMESFTTLASLSVTNSGLRTFICSEAKTHPQSKSIRCGTVVKFPTQDGKNE